MGVVARDNRLFVDGFYGTCAPARRGFPFWMFSTIRTPDCVAFDDELKKAFMITFSESWHKIGLRISLINGAIVSVHNKTRGAKRELK